MLNLFDSPPSPWLKGPYRSLRCKSHIVEDPNSPTTIPQGHNIILIIIVMKHISRVLNHFNSRRLTQVSQSTKKCLENQTPT